MPAERQSKVQGSQDSLSPTPCPSFPLPFPTRWLPLSAAWTREPFRHMHVAHLDTWFMEDLSPHLPPFKCPGVPPFPSDHTALQVSMQEANVLN